MAVMKHLDSLNIATPKTQLIHSLDDLKLLDMDVYVLKPKFARRSKQVSKIRKGGRITRNYHFSQK